MENYQGYGRNIPIIAKDVLSSSLKEKRFYLAAIYFVLIPVVLNIFNNIGSTLVQSGSGIALYYAQTAILQEFKSIYISFFLGQILLVILAADLIAGEVEHGTISLLKTKPVYDSEIILGKFLGSMGVISILDLPAIIYIYFSFLTKLDATWPGAYFGTLDEIIMALIVLLLLQSIIVAMTIMLSTVFAKTLYAILASLLALFIISTISTGMVAAGEEYNYLSFEWLLDAIMPYIFYHVEPMEIDLPGLFSFLGIFILIPALFLFIAIISLRRREAM
jgi:ABC-type transport system involved in multi-copper enzyme maturation permease subunit